MDFTDLYHELKKIMQCYEKHLVCVSNEVGNYHLDTLHIMKNKKSLFFGAVKINKNYVSYHLMPVYVNADLLTNISDNLRKRMQGKSCFNFKSEDVALFEELKSLTQEGYTFYQNEGYILT